MKELDDFQKAIKIIESCTTQAQIDSAQQYVELYMKSTHNIELIRKLVDKLNARILDISNQK